MLIARTSRPTLAVAAVMPVCAKPPAPLHSKIFDYPKPRSALTAVVNSTAMTHLLIERAPRFNTEERIMSSRIGKVGKRLPFQIAALSLFSVLFLLTAALSARAAPDADLWGRWTPHDDDAAFT
ncbi:MAG: hypothetical protein VW547_02620, partial [Alphaproteobacteria bacterium]